MSPRPTDNAASRAFCPGPLQRRNLLRLGLGGFASLSLPALLNLRNASAAPATNSLPTAVILVWLRGGQSHLDTLDPKPHASSDFRGPFAPISTSIPGLQVTELMPRLAGIADRYAVVRSLMHTGGGHPAGSLQM